MKFACLVSFDYFCIRSIKQKGCNIIVGDKFMPNINA